MVIFIHKLYMFFSNLILMANKKFIVGRHFIISEETFETFKEIVGNVNVAADLYDTVFRPRFQSPVEFGLKLTVDEAKITDDLRLRILDEMRRLPSPLWMLYDPKDRGPGTSYQQVAFNPTFFADKKDVPTTLIYADFDQFVFDTEEGLEAALCLADKTEKDNCLHGIGSRNVPVVLATNERNSNLRIIHELFHSLTIGGDRLRGNILKVRGEPLQGVTPAYAEIGESTTGFYVFNTAHTRYLDLAAAVAQASRRANMRGFATDYFAAIKSAQFGRIATGYVVSRPNKFYGKKDEAEEFEGVKRLISGQTRELAKTDIDDYLIGCVSDNSKHNIERIAKFYPREDVELVRDLMLE